MSYLHADAVAGAAYVEQTFTPVDEVFVETSLRFAVSGAAQFQQDFFDLLLVGGVSQVSGFFWDWSSGWFLFFTGGSGNDPSPAPVSDVYQTITYHWVKGGTVELHVDGALIWTDTNGDVDQAERIWLGQTFNADVTGVPVDFAYVKVGTTLGGDDLFSDDFESGDLSAWSSTTGDVTVVGDPDAPVFALPSVFEVAFDDPTLEPEPTWTQLG